MFFSRKNECKFPKCERVKSVFALARPLADGVLRSPNPGLQEGQARPLQGVKSGHCKGSVDDEMEGAEADDSNAPKTTTSLLQLQLTRPVKVFGG